MIDPITVPIPETPEDCLAPSVKRLLSNAERILEMAEDLRAHDLRIEALQFAVIAAQHLQAARSLQRIYDLTAPLGSGAEQL